MENIKRVHLHYPWLSMLLAFTAIACLFIIANPHLIITRMQGVPDGIFNTAYQAGALVMTLFIILWDVSRFYRKRKRHNDALNTLFTTKKQLQNKAHTYASHSDKLKLFISDRLLEYIQYDEKFMHFKNIAAEVRHNGVICFDKVQTALTLADQHHAQQENQDALASMRYLWDLLDLSTTDNIALHIGNYLCECEEHYFQSILQDNKKIKVQSPYQTTFLVDQVLVDCLQPLVDEPQTLMKSADSDVTQYEDSQFKVNIERNIEMLGNPNHLRLLFENLINNAQFYHKKNKLGTKLTRPIILELKNINDTMLFRIYNYGQAIPEEKKDKIFQLGYSSRRKKEYHGKGLGLYFVNSIAQGYEGSVSFNNIKNNNDTFIATFYGENGEEKSIGFTLTLEHNKPVLILDEPTKLKTNNLVDKEVGDNYKKHKKLEQKIDFTIIKLELLSTYSRTLYTVNITEDKKESVQSIENALGITTWNIKIKKQRHATQVVLVPIDISGVVFSTTLPTVQARLHYDELQDDDIGINIDINSDIDEVEILSREREFKDD